MSVAPLSPTESISGKPRRRYSLALTREIVQASLHPGVYAAQVARQYGLNGNLLHTWRWQYRNGLFGTVTEASSVSLTGGLILEQLCADALADISASGSERGLPLNRHN